MTQVWFNSVLNFHKQVFGGGGEVTIDDLKNSDYIEKGAAWEMFFCYLWRFKRLT